MAWNGASPLVQLDLAWLLPSCSLARLLVDYAA